MLQRAKNGIMPTQKARGKELVGYRGGPSVRSEMKQAEGKVEAFLESWFINGAPRSREVLGGRI